MAEGEGSGTEVVAGRGRVIEGVAWAGDLAFAVTALPAALGVAALEDPAIVVCLVLFFWLTAAVYIGATLLVREKPLVYSGSRSEYEFWRRNQRDYWRHS